MNQWHEDCLKDLRVKVAQEEQQQGLGAGGDKNAFSDAAYTSQLSSNVAAAPRPWNRYHLASTQGPRPSTQAQTIVPPPQPGTKDPAQQRTESLFTQSTGRTKGSALRDLMAACGIGRGASTGVRTTFLFRTYNRYFFLQIA